MIKSIDFYIRAITKKSKVLVLFNIWVPVHDVAHGPLPDSVLHSFDRRFGRFAGRVSFCWNIKYFWKNNHFYLIVLLIVVFVNLVMVLLWRVTVLMMVLIGYVFLLNEWNKILKSQFDFKYLILLILSLLWVVVMFFVVTLLIFLSFDHFLEIKIKI